HSMIRKRFITCTRISSKISRTNENQTSLGESLTENRRQGNPCWNAVRRPRRTLTCRRPTATRRGGVGLWSRLFGAGEVPRDLVGDLLEDYRAEAEQAVHLLQHAERARYPQVAETLRRLAEIETRHAGWLRDRLALLGATAPAVEPEPAPARNQWQRAAASRTRVTAAARAAGSRTTPPLPTCPRPTSNCGFTSASTAAPGASTAATRGRTSVSEMNDTSMVARSGVSGSISGPSARTFVRSRTKTRASCRS